MSAPNFTPIQLFRTSTASAIPTAGSLADGELAINLTDERLYFKNAAGVVKLLASNTGSLGTVTSVAASGGTTGLTFSGSPITTSGTLTLGGTLAVANGGTGVTTSTGTGSVVLSNSPTLVTPTLGVASADSIATLKGTVGSVAYGFISNTNTGMWSPSSDAIAFSTAGSERLRVTSTGNVGVGTATPGNGTRLNVAGRGLFTGGAVDPFDGTASGVSISYDTVNNIGNVVSVQTGVSERQLNIAANPITFRTAGTERMRIDSAGNVGIGLSAPAYRLHVGGRITSQTSTSDWAFLNDASGGAVRGGLWVGSGGDIGVANSTVANGWFAGTSIVYAITNFAERMRIDGNGNVGIGTSSPAARLDLNGNTAQNIVAVAALDVDCTLGNFFTKTIAANSTFTFSNPPASRAYAFTLEIVHTSGTITWPTTVRWPGNTAPTLTTGRTHLITFVTDNGGTIWYGAPQVNYQV